MSAPPVSAPLTLEQETVLAALAGAQSTLMGILNKLREDKKADPRCVATGITNIEQGCMWAEKAVKTGNYKTG